jgi:hypothetical protein
MPCIYAGSVSTHQNSSDWLKFIAGLDWRKGNLNHAENEAFIRAVSLGIDQNTAIEMVAAKIRAAGDSPKYQKLEREFESACFYAGHGAPKGHPHWSKGAWTKHDAEPEAAFDLAYLEKFTASLPESVDEVYLEARSQYTCWNRSPAGFLHKIFRAGERVWVTANEFSREGVIWTHDGPGQNLADLDHFRSGHDGVWFLSNPIDGIEHQADRLRSQHNPEGVSFRCLEAITSWRYAVIETDHAPEELWLKALVLLDLPVVAIYHSGGRGPHALVDLGADSRAEWHELLSPYREHLIRLGACPGTLTPLRLTRLPACVRGQTGRMQQLLYLAPDADGPIYQRTPREDDLAVWERWITAARFGRSDNDDLKGLKNGQPPPKNAILKDYNRKNER